MGAGTRGVRNVVFYTIRFGPTRAKQGAHLLDEGVSSRGGIHHVVDVVVFGEVGR